MLGHIMLDLEGLELSQEEREIVAHPQVGGVILFTRNYHSPEQLHLLIQQIRSIPQKSLLIAVDQEGGRVQRFREDFTVLPSAQQLGQAYDEDAVYAKSLAEQIGWLMAAELRAYDIDLSFAPVLDLNQGVSQVIGDRSFHQLPTVVAELAIAYCQGMQKAGMSAVGKHFPGHGSVTADSHTAIPIDERMIEEIIQQDLFPFAKLVANNLSGIMPAHVIYQHADDKPAGFSNYWLEQVLRQQLNFKGAIFSDDLSMKGASVIGNFSVRADRALAAGCDMILICNHRQDSIEVINHLGSHVDSIAQQRLLSMRGKLRRDQPQELKQSARWKQVQLTLSNFWEKK